MSANLPASHRLAEDPERSADCAMVRGFRAQCPVALAAALLAGHATAMPAGRGVDVERVTIQANGARSDAVTGDESVASCRRFQLTPADVRGYFAQAAPVERRAFEHDLNMSRCHARGVLQTARGRQARWFIDLERRGRLEFAGGLRLHFFCPDCTSSKFDELDDDDRENARSLLRSRRMR